jgi:hypothetical protein
VDAITTAALAMLNQNLLLILLCLSLKGSYQTYVPTDPAGRVVLKIFP